MYHCMACKVEYECEDDAKDCCTYFTIGEDMYDVISPRKMGKFVGATHSCPNVKLAGRSWSTFIKAGEGCPMCDYVDMGR